MMAAEMGEGVAGRRSEPSGVCVERLRTGAFGATNKLVRTRGAARVPEDARPAGATPPGARAWCEG